MPKTIRILIVTVIDSHVLCHVRHNTMVKQCACPKTLGRASSSTLGRASCDRCWDRHPCRRPPPCLLPPWPSTRHGTGCKPSRRCTEQANALPSVVPRLMTLSPFETMTSCMVPSAAWRIGILCSSGSQREHRTYRFGHPTPEPQALLGILSLLLALGSAFPYSAARGAARRSASPHVIHEHLAELLGVQAQKLLVQGCSYVLPCLLELVRL